MIQLRQFEVVYSTREITLLLYIGFSSKIDINRNPVISEVIARSEARVSDERRPDHDF